MEKRISSHFTRASFLIVDALLLFVCLSHIPSIVQRGRFPFSITERSESILITDIISTEHAPSLTIGDRLVSVDTAEPRNIFELQFVADTKKKNDTVNVVIQRSGEELRSTIALLPFYESTRFILLTFFVGLVMLILSGLLVSSIPHEPLVHHLHNMNVALSTALMLTWGSIEVSTLSIAAVILFFTSYILFGFIFLLFCRALWKPDSFDSQWLTLSMYGIIIIFAGWISYLYLSSAEQVSLELFRIFSNYLFILRLFVVATVFCGMALLIIALGNKSSPEDGTRIRWIIGGIIAGGLPYTLFGIIPVTFIGVDAFAEELSTVFFLLIPLCVSVAFIRYNLLNLQSFVRRQRVSTVFRLLIYLCIVFIAAVLAGHLYGIDRFDSVVVVSLITGSTVALLLPVGKRFEQYVDERLFKTKLNFRKILKDSVTELHRALDDRTLFHTLLTIIHDHLPVQSVILYQNTDGRIKQVERIGTDDGDFNIPPNLLQSFAREKSSIIELNTTNINEVQHDYALLIRLQSGELFAVIGLIMEMRRETLEDEDKDFLTSLANESSQMLERFRLQEEIILERNEAQRLEEMNELKSFFVSSVSHDLRLPLTSIQMYAEMLNESKKYTSQKKKAFVRTILGESGRLRRYVENILDINSIERETFKFAIVPVDLRLIVKRSVKTMEYERKKYSARISISIPKSPVFITGDEAALVHVITNLLSNAMKYSHRRPIISISVRKLALRSVVTVADNGIGIPKHEQLKIFEKFYRGEYTAEHEPGGTGIGLAVVKYIVQQHRGSISLVSAGEKGSSFTLSFPLIVKY
ncbi:MAG: sensor histidine kinase [Bacteroidota bacterium]